MAIRSYAIHVTASFNGQTVEECLMARGVSVTLDEYGPMALPVPDGFRYVAKMDWMRPGELRVIDGKGEMYVATTEGSVELEHESIHLEIRVVRQFRYQRLPSFAAAMSSLAGLASLGNSSCL